MLQDLAILANAQLTLIIKSWIRLPSRPGGDHLKPPKRCGQQVQCLDRILSFDIEGQQYVPCGQDYAYRSKQLPNGPHAPTAVGAGQRLVVDPNEAARQLQSAMTYGRLRQKSWMSRDSDWKT